VNINKTFPGRYESLAGIGEFVHAAAVQAGFDSFSVYAVELAVDEACTNIIEHAYRGENRGNIDCKCEISREGLTIILHDHGQSFRPEEILPPDIHSPIEDRQAHGLGLYFMRNWMDEVHFDFSGNHGNTLVMFKKLEKKGV
jgi:serine/threonine-protein kinase RsbW